MLFGNVHHAHVNFALQPNQCSGCGQCHAVLPCTCFGDNFGLTHLFRQQHFADAVVDFVRARVVQILAFEVDLCAVGRELGEVFGVVNRAGTTNIGLVQAFHLCDEFGIIDDVIKRGFDFFHFNRQYRMPNWPAVFAEKARLVGAHHFG